jgi:hypothetical protein
VHSWKLSIRAYQLLEDHAMKRWIAVLLLGLAVTNAGLAQPDVMRIEVTPSNQEPLNGPLTIPLSLPKEWAKLDEVDIVVLTGKDPAKAVGQLTSPGIATEAIKPAKEGLIRRDLHLVLTTKCIGLDVHFKKTDMQVTRFAWTEKKGEYQELILTRSGTFTPVLRYMNRPYDSTSVEARNKSYKVFHHLFDPAGKRLVTNGGYADDGATDTKKLLYPHHRGIMYGFNKCSYGPGLKSMADTWHCPSEEDKKKNPKAPVAHVEHEKTLSVESGPVLGRHRVLLSWRGDNDVAFLREERELTVYHVKGGTLVEFASRLKTTGGKVKLDGDPQHAGFQFRAHNDVAAKTKSQTYYLHPDGSKGEMGKERNWPADKTMYDLPWYAMSFVLDDQRYTTCYMNHPKNPQPTRFSERDYGRFGGYFERMITEEMPLVVQYRLWLQTGELTKDQGAALRNGFAFPPPCMVK